MDQKKVNKRCPKGTRKNLKTGVCEPFILVPVVLPKPIINLEQEQQILDQQILDQQILDQQILDQQILDQQILDQQILDQQIQEPVQDPVQEPLQDPIQIQSLPKKRCKNGTRRNLQGDCIPNKKTSITKKQKIIIQPGSPVQIDIDSLPKVINQEPIIQQVIIQEPIIQDSSDIKLKDKIGHLPSDSNEYIREKERIESQFNSDPEFNFLYPNINDPNFNIKIAQRKEFNDTQYDGTIYNIKEQSNLMCDAEFELMPHQLFVKNFLSFQTPYNSLLLYHGLGSGKTCSAIGVAEEMRNYMKQIGIKQRIIVIASPNVQDNFRLQLFDEKKLKPDGDLWNIQSCIGNSMLKEINPTNIGGLTREKVISNIKSIINNYYVFMGYVEFANYITKKTAVSIESGYSEQERKQMKIKNIKRVFNNRLIIIDEVHNIRITDDNKNKRIGIQLFELAKYSDNLRFLFLSATPMYNTYKEIVWLTNIMNLNDGRGQIDITEIFEKDGTFKESVNLKDGSITESGKALLQRKLIGYVSYIRGENPYTFPYRIYPNTFSPENTFRIKQDELTDQPEQPAQLFSTQSFSYPTIQLNNKPIEEPLKYINVFLSKMGEYQELGYSYIINHMKYKSGQPTDSLMPNFENMDSFGYTMLMEPLEALNIIYPNPELDNFIVANSANVASQDTISQMIGKQGLSNIMNSVDDSFKKPPMRYNFDYKPAILAKYGRIFSQTEIHKYSNKIASICNTIRKSKGIIIIYSQYIDGGIVPISLALEEMGFLRYGHASYTKSLFKKPPVELLDAVTLTGKSQVPANEFKQAQYMTITGDKSFSPNNAQDIKYVTDADNKYGHLVKVVLISKAGSEGLDFKNIRQVHIMEPWYNMNRIEQIIGRGVRNLSHCLLPFEQRNVELYLHSSIKTKNPEEECADLYVYRLAEKKAIQIGRVTRVIKENAVDCILNIGQSKFTIENLNEMAENQNIEIELSSGNTIQYKIGDRQYTDVCDYMDNCEYTCSPTQSIKEDDIVKDTYNTAFVSMNNDRIIERIRDLFKDRYFYKREELINAINITKQYPIEQIYNAFTFFVKNKTETLTDKYGRIGYLIDKMDDKNNAYYAFQPIEITDNNASIYDRSVPVGYKRNNLIMETASELPQTAAKQIIQSVDISIDAFSIEPYLQLLHEFEDNLQYIYTDRMLPPAEREYTWYMHGRKMKDHIHKVRGLSEEIIKVYFVYHMLDTLLFNQKMHIIQVLYSESWKPLSKTVEMKQIEEIIKIYFDRCIMRTVRKTGVLFNKDNSWKIYVQSKENLTQWTEGQPEDATIFSAEILKKIVPVKKLADRIGFMSLFKNNEMVFYVKDMTKKRNIGARADSAGKVKVIELINYIQSPTQEIYTNENTKLISQVGLCIILEMLMRYKTEQSGPLDKVYYLLPEQAAIIKVKEL